MLEHLKKEVYEAHLTLVQEKLVFQTWGNVSAIDRGLGRVVIKPSGLQYYKMKPRDMVVVDLDGHVVEGTLKPSVDLPIHLAIYKNIETSQSVIHTHSHYATCWAQAQKPIPCMGTTHADYFYYDVPLTKVPDTEDYENNIGKVVVECIKANGKERCKAVLVPAHGPFVWGESIQQAIEFSIVLEEIAKMAFHTVLLSGGKSEELGRELIEKHYNRKWGSHAYYGQSDGIQ